MGGGRVFQNKSWASCSLFSSAEETSKGLLSLERKSAILYPVQYAGFYLGRNMCIKKPLGQLTSGPLHLQPRQAMTHRRETDQASLATPPLLREASRARQVRCPPGPLLPLSSAPAVDPPGASVALSPSNNTSENASCFPDLPSSWLVLTADL